MALPVFMPESMKYETESEVFLGKMSNIISVQPRRYESKPGDLTLDDKQKSHLRECYFLDYIRWKYDESGEILSNSKMVRFEDGS
jgi:hypothetical protein